MSPTIVAGVAMVTAPSIFIFSWVYPLNVIITERRDNVIFPLQQFIKHAPGLWYTMPLVDDKHSDELVFSNFDYL